MSARGTTPRLTSTPNRRSALRGVLVAVVLVGIAVRLIGVGSMSLWLDEAAIANVVSRGNLAGYLGYPASNRPFGYLLVSGWLAALHNSELVLRSTSLLPSLLSVLLVVPVARELLRSGLFVVLATLSVALSGWLVGAAKEFKPYALEHCVILVWLWLYLAVRRHGSRRALIGLLASMAVAPLFAHAPTFALPIYGVLLFLECRRRAWPELARVTLVVVLFGLGVALAQYAWIGTRTSPELFVAWTASFFDASRGDSPLAWTLERVRALVTAFVPLGRDPATAVPWMTAAFDAVCVVGWLAGIVRFLVRRELWLLAVLAGPLLPPLLLGFVGVWPFGPERVNLYASSLLMLTVLLGWEAVLGGERRTAVRIAFVVVFLGLQLPLDLASFAGKETRYAIAQEEVVHAVAEIAAHEAELIGADAQRAALLCNGMSGHAMTYYRRFNDVHAADVRGVLSGRHAEWLASRRPGVLEDAIHERMPHFPALWILLAHYREAELDEVRRALASPDVEILYERAFPGVMLFAARAAPRARTD